MLDKTKLAGYTTGEWQELFTALGMDELSFKGCTPLNLSVRTTKQNRVDTYLKIIAGITGKSDNEVEDMITLLRIK